MARINQQRRNSVSRLVTPVALAIALTACSTPPKPPEKVDITSEPTQSAQSYMVRADSLQGSIQNDLLIMALKATLLETNTNQALLLLNRLEKSNLSDIQQAEWLLAKADYFNQLNQPQEALQALNFPQWWKLPDQQWKDYHVSRAELSEQVGDYLNASREYSLQSDYLTEQEKAEINKKIWANLAQLSNYEINAIPSQDIEPELSAWVQLKIYMNTLQGNVSQLQKAIQIWLQENPEHPAAKVIPEDVQAVLELEIIQPQNTALLLPVSGKYAKQATLIRDGFVLALMDDLNRKEDATLTIIDTNKIDIEQLNQTLVEKNIDFVVGPLLKENIEKLSTSQQELGKKVPSLALNLPNEVEPSMENCYISLSPEQEVEQAAKHLFAQGFQYPLIMVPKGAFGERVAIAFQNEWAKFSRNQAEVSYFGNKAQLQQNVNNVFGISESKSRIARMENLLEIEFENQARNRRDIDSVYIVAKSSELTLIKPFIEVAINPETKPPRLFANSRSNTGGKRQFEDLSGVIFSDIPLLVENDANLTSQLNELWPEQSNAQRRLQALGMDAYQMISELPQMKVSPEYKVKGKTGTLSIDDHCVIHREISWSEHGTF